MRQMRHEKTRSALPEPDYAGIESVASVEKRNNCYSITSTRPSTHYI